MRAEGLPAEVAVASVIASGIGTFAASFNGHVVMLDGALVARRVEIDVLRGHRPHSRRRSWPSSAP
jgi:hypothetical protein